MGMKHGQAECTRSMDKQLGNAANIEIWTLSMEMQHGHGALACRMGLHVGHVVWGIQYGHAVWMQHGHAAWTHGHTA